MSKNTEEQLSLFPLTIYKYLLLISPPHVVMHRIQELKKIFGTEFKSHHALVSKAHLSLCGFNADESKQELIEGIIEFVVSKCPAFDIELNGFDGFEPHTIYIKVKENNILNKLHYYLMKSFKFSHGNFIPHITIARELKYPQYKQAIEIYRQQRYEDSFKVGRLLLLKKQANSYYIPVKTFTLLGQ